jgi:hypothetical protein
MRGELVEIDAQVARPDKDDRQASIYDGHFNSVCAQHNRVLGPRGGQKRALELGFDDSRSMLAWYAGDSSLPSSISDPSIFRNT